MTSRVLDTAVVGGSAVLIGYASLYFTKILKKLTKKYTKKEFFYWSLSAILTVISFLYIIIIYSFFEEQDDVIFRVGLSTFLIGAVLWSASILYQYLVNNKKKTKSELLALTLTTIGSILILITNIKVYRDEDLDIINKTLLVISGIILVFHHLFFDNFYWYFIQN